MNRDQFLSLSLTDLSFKELVALFKRRWAVVLGTTLFFIGIGLLISLNITKTWRASTVIVVEGKTQMNNGMGSDIVGALAQTSVDYDVLTQIQIMSSYRVLFDALKRIDYPMPDQLDDDAFQKMPKVSIQQIQTTNTVQVSVEYKDDSIAARLATAIPQIYKEQVLENQQNQVQRSLEFISARLEEERKNLSTRLTELASYKAENNVADVRSESEFRQGQLAEAQRRLSEAQTEVRAAEAAQSAAQIQFESLPKTIENPNAITPVDNLTRATEILESLQASRDALLVNNLETSDRVKRIDAQIKGQAAYLQKLKDGKQVDVRSTQRNPLRDEMERSYIFAKASFKGAVARLEALRGVVDEKSAAMRAFAPIMAKQQEKETAISDVATSIQRLSSIHSDIQLRNNFLQSPIKDVTGSTPAQFVRPILPLNLGLAGLVGLFLGCIFALVRDVSLDKVNTSSEASLIAEKEILGRIPLRSSVRDPLIADPQKARAFEAYRILRSSILLAGKDKKAFMITSTVPKEGKSTVAANLAVALALEGKKTILVDGNLRSPAVHKLFKVDRAKGAADVLGGTLSLSEALKISDVPNLVLLTAGAESANPTELVASSAMTDLIETLKGQADIVLVDAPAAFGYADTQSLVSAVKDVVYVTHLETPSKSKMRESVGMIDFAGGTTLGIILNKDKTVINRMRGA